MPSLRYSASLLIILFLAACDENVVSIHKIGLQPSPIEKEEWEGQWISSDGKEYITVSDETKGIITFLPKMDENGQEREKEYTAYMMQGNKWTYLNIDQEIEDDFDEEEREDFTIYGWTRISKDVNQILMWFPSIDSFKVAIEKGLIEGSFDDVFGVFLTDDPAKIVELVENYGAEYFEWEKPLVLIREKEYEK